MFVKKFFTVIVLVSLASIANSAILTSIAVIPTNTTFFNHSASHPAPPSNFMWDNTALGTAPMTDSDGNEFLVYNSVLSLGAVGGQAMLADTSSGGYAEASFEGGNNNVTSFSFNGSVLFEPGYAHANPGWYAATATPLLTGYITSDFTMEEDNLSTNVVSSEGLTITITGGLLVDTGFFGLTLTSGSVANVSMLLGSDSVNDFSTTDIDVASGSLIEINIVPEPVTMLLFGCAGLYGRKRLNRIKN